MKKKGDMKMELLDIYDEQGNFLGSEERAIVHRDALWHKTIHCWLYDKFGNVFFQIRKDSNTLYTTASGHLQKGESIPEGFEREIFEEIGINIDANDATLVAVVPFVMDKPLKDGSVFRDRAFANVYVDLYEGNYQDFKFDETEVDGLVLVNAEETLRLFINGSGSVMGKIIREGAVIEKEIYFQDFLVNAHEKAISKYGDILKKIIELSQV